MRKPHNRNKYKTMKSEYKIIPQKTEGIFIVEKLKGDTIIATYNVDVQMV